MTTGARSSPIRRTLFGLVAALLGSVVLLVLMESAARLLVYYAENVRTDPRAAADTYGGASWTEAYYAEHLASGAAEWVPFSYWRRLPFAGQFINVDSRGLRKTWAPPGGAAAAPRILILGGSTVWGSGARDDETIPSHVSRLLAARSVSAEVVNLGESGYVTGQDLATLQRRLREGDSPKVVVFYGGINDIYSAFQGREAGIPQNESNRRLEFNSAQPKRPDKAAWIATAGIRHVLGILGRRVMRTTGRVTGLDATEESALLSGLAADYCGNRRLVSALAREYGFEALFAIQPVIFGKRQLTAYESREAGLYEYARGFFDQAYQRLTTPGQACGGAQLLDLSHEFDAEATAIYVDALHLGELGNARIAAAMLPAVTAALSRSGAPVQP